MLRGAIKLYGFGPYLIFMPENEDLYQVDLSQFYQLHTIFISPFKSLQIEVPLKIDDRLCK